MCIFTYNSACMTKLILFSLYSLILFFMTCGKVGDSPTFGDDGLPYPSVEEQRKQLANKPFASPVRVLDSTQLVADIEYLASDVCEGRKPGTLGHTKAVERIIGRLSTFGLDSFSARFSQNYAGFFGSQGQNIIGWVKGTANPDKYIVLSAHYDHLGKTADGKVYYGADDNASGVACLLALAKYIEQHPHKYSVVFAFFDQEETGLEGSNYYVSHLNNQIRAVSVVLNLNMDMVARSDKNEIFACGIRRNNGLKYLIDSVQSRTNVKLLMGHDGHSSGEDWTTSSDHSAFSTLR